MDTAAPYRPVWSRRTLLPDGLLALGLMLFVWAQISIPRSFFEHRVPVPPGGFPGAGARHFVPSVVAYALIALACIPLVLRRRFPVAVLAAVTVGVAAYEALPALPPSFIQVALMVALYTAGTLLERPRLILWTWVATAVMLAATLPAWSSEMFLADLVRTVAVMLFAAALGDATRNRRAYVVEVERRAEEAERAREEETRRRVDEERLRIARELHDITAHSLSIVAVQSGVALHVLDGDPAAARTALVAIRDTSRSSLQELRAMLGVLRREGEAAESAPLAPTPGLTRLDELVRPLRAAGLEVTVDADLGDDPLPAIVDASAYRIVQEAFTNILRHAGHATVRVSLRRTGERLTIEVVDDGAPAGTPAGIGHGIAGMRERAVALGGTFEAGPVPPRGWRVLASMPISGRT